MSSIPVLHKRGKLSKAQKSLRKTGKTIGQIINELVENSLQNFMEAAPTNINKRPFTNTPKINLQEENFANVCV